MLANDRYPLNRHALNFETVVFYILSDDLTGASGVASMVDVPGTATVNLERLSPELARRFSCIAVNLETRDRNGGEAAERLSSALDLVGESPVAVRIDSALRGHVQTSIRALLERGDVMVTDTIPEYGRRTVSGKTCIGTQQRDIASLLAPLRRGTRARTITIADSETQEDLDLLALRCIDDNLIPVDPGPLVARVARKKLGLDAPASNCAAGKTVSSVAFVVGTRDPRSLEQIRHMKDLGFAVQEPGLKRAEGVDVFTFSIGNQKSLITRPFLEQLAGYDALVLSGGTTANHVLGRSGFECLLNDGQVQPLVSSALVSGGVFDGKRVVLKGGFIGDEKTYKTILDWLRRE